ncbi:tyrosine-type recombinase/integrase [Pelagibacterium flavum]|uniref:Tyrosine-type recombinase/integrase n=1 Tax=Pelagibacterium flavum TaxID=2984530 RepID=A0ABY6IU92_9HYPH|nr:site-specific integrase [Pelagibacterium sp. YIM 151497]UYQ72877.1 tyrosine-type recombinase/integrase [Pelagibacterium sp. YIM 151497]
MADRLTDKIAKNAEPPSKGSRIIYCDGFSGFGLRVTQAGAKSFVLNYRINGRERRTTLGQYPQWSVSAARTYAAELRRNIDQGIDPLEIKDRARTAPTVYDLYRKYAQEHLPSKRARSAADDDAMWQKLILPRMGKIKVEELAPHDVDALHRWVSQDRPVRANRTIEVLRKALNLAIRWGWIEKNAAVGVRKNLEHPRERFLSDAEMKAISDALGSLSERVSADAIRLLMLTGARKGEVLRAEWREFDLEAGIWTKPSHHTKQKRQHRVPISTETLKLLRRVKSEQTSQRFVFPGRTPDQSLTDIKRSWQSVREKATVALWRAHPQSAALIRTLEQELQRQPKIAEVLSAAQQFVTNIPHGVLDVRIHDLRHTYASLLVGKGASLPLIGALLGHTQSQTTHRYAHLADDPLRAATELVGQVYSNARGDSTRGEQR